MLWVLLKSADEAGNRLVQVSTDQCSNIDDFITAIKAKLSGDLSGVGNNRINLHLTEDGPALASNIDIPPQNTMETALIVTIPHPAPVFKSMSFEDATMDYICEATEIQPTTQPWTNIPVDETIFPSATFIEAFKMNSVTFDFRSKAGRRTVIDLFLRDIIYRFPQFQIKCDYHLSSKNRDTQRCLEGKCDYMISFIDRYDPHLVVVEETLNDQTSRLRRCIGQCAAIHYKRKAALMDDLRVYGMYSNGEFWAFVFIDNDGVVHVSDRTPVHIGQYVEREVHRIYRLIYAVVQQSFQSGFA